MPLLDVRELHSGYRDVSVLHGLSCHVDAGEIVTIVGANGAGKTTLLRTISGLLAPSAGQILLESEPIHGLQPHVIVGKGLVQVPEGRQLFGNLTVRENLLVGSHSKEARQRRRQTLGMVFDLFPVLAERQRQRAMTLSGGEQQMLATARALMACPTLLMLDEPSWGLAPILVGRLFEAIEQINRQGVTILLVEQNAYRALSMAHRAYVMELGALVRQGGGKELLEHPELKVSYLGLSAP
jgi:branched-chain amino acid transport system ATP-binding protein